MSPIKCNKFIATYVRDHVLQERRISIAWTTKQEVLPLLLLSDTEVPPYPSITEEGERPKVSMFAIFFFVTFEKELHIISIH